MAYWAITIGANIAQSPREVTDALGITAYFDPGGFQRQLLLGSDVVGEEALIRFYLLHVMILPLVLSTLLAVHFWRIRKDGGLARPADADRRLGPPAERRLSGVHRAPAKTYHLAAIVRGRTEAVGRGPENTVPSMPHLFYAELGVLMVTVLICLALALVSNAPLKELANPDVPENPAKAPWYFLGLQELVSFSAFMGGVGIPAIVLLGLGLIPFLDREEQGTGDWFGGPGGGRLAARVGGRRPGGGDRHRGRGDPLRLAARMVPRHPATGDHGGQSGHDPRAGVCGVFAVAGPAIQLDPRRRAWAVHLFPLRIPCPDRDRHLFPRAELGFLLVARRLAQTLGQRLPATAKS